MSEANTVQVGGDHYASPYQHWDFVHDALMGLYLEGQITKYVFRWRKKNGIQDLEKALHFLHKLQEDRSQSLASLNGEAATPVEAYLERFIVENHIETLEAEIIGMITLWASKFDLESAEHRLRNLITREKLRPS